MTTITIIRSSIFVGFLLFFGLLQLVIPSRKPDKGRWQYMASNLLLVFVNNVVIMLIPLIPYGIAITSEEKGYGLFNMVTLPLVIEIIIAIIILDIVIYFQHRLFHHFNWLWRIHKVHHCDPLLDTTTGLRFHPFEIVISNFIKVLAIFVLGVAPISVIIFEIVLNTLAMFNHSNLRLPQKLETILNKILITPAIHTIHHSRIKKETQSNFGFSVPWWDMIFGTFILEGEKPQEMIHIGLYKQPEEKWTKLPGMLVFPFI